MTPRTSRLFAALSLAGLLLAPVARAQDATVTTVRIERERPQKERIPTLRFLKANRDFIRARFDRLRQESRESAAGAGELDPRFLLYRQLLSEVAAGKDSVQVNLDARERAGLFASVSDLAALESELDLMERMLDAQRARLGVLQKDFAGRQRTELDLVLTGGPLAGRVDSVAIVFEDGTRAAAAIDSTQRAAMLHGATFELFHGLIEPREQVLDLALIGEGWSQTGHGFVTLEPTRDRITFLKLDLSHASPARGIASVVAGTWLLEPQLPTAEASGNRP
ncbi:MAG: hypothetical protein ABL977_04560 [Candidatus Eisenbacteria bacterium]